MDSILFAEHLEAYLYAQRIPLRNVEIAVRNPYVREVKSPGVKITWHSRY